MGSFLDKPKTDKDVTSGEGHGLHFAVAAMQGWRGNMEDAHNARIGLPNLPDWSFFGVYDGHAGMQVSKHVSENLLEQILSTEGFKDPEDTAQVRKGIRQGFLDLDKNIADSQGVPGRLEGKDHSGTTVIVVVVSPTHFYFANCGDSRALLCRSNNVEFATVDHKPCNQEEKARIEKAGGNVLLSRVNGSLAVSRALGDFAFKHIQGLDQTEQMVSPEPDVTILERDHEKDEFLMLACDGVWDVVTNENLVEYIHDRLLETDDLGSILSNLLDYCLFKDSKDNMTAVLVTFPAAPKIDEEAVKKRDELSEEACTAIKEKVFEIIETGDALLDDLDELSVTQQLERTLKDEFFIISRRKFIAQCLDEANAEKEKAAAKAKAEAAAAAAAAESGKDSAPSGADSEGKTGDTDSAQGSSDTPSGETA